MVKERTGKLLEYGKSYISMNNILGSEDYILSNDVLKY